ncbi:MAG: ABC transporter permease/M1 family aminopeptidase [Janthinobacterium lividum]
MTLFLEFCLFELKFRLKSVSTYVYFAMWFLLSFLAIAAEDFINTGNGKQLLNGPYSTTTLYSFFSFFGILVLAGIFGPAVLRDFQRDTYQLIFTKPITKVAYLGGRWLGSFLTCVFVFSGMVFGEWAGTYAPWADHTRIVHGHLWWYWQPFLSITVVQIFFIGSLFFMVAALSRKIFIVYLQGVALFLLYLIFVNAFSATRSLEHFWSGILDPIGLQLTDVVARYWTVAEKNSRLLSWTGVMLYNRLLWIGVGITSLLATYRFFPLSAEALTTRSQGRRAARARVTGTADEPKSGKRSLVAARLPNVQQSFGRGLGWRQYVSLTRLHVRNITRELPFWAILILLAVFSLAAGYFVGQNRDATVYPVTFLMLQSVEGNSQLFLYIIATLYAGELIWRERETRFAGIHDALPLRETTDWLGKFTAVVLVELGLLVVSMLCGVFMQTVRGYFHYEFLQYFQELFLIVFPQILGFTLIAFFVQTVVSNKFIGHAIVVAVFLAQIVLFRFGLENTLMVPGQVPTYTYSDMNGYGHFVPAILWSLMYWTAIFAVLGVLSMALARRGAEDSLRHRMHLLQQRLPPLLPATAVFALVAVLSGAWFYYNAHVLNEFLTSKQRRDIQADYERDFRKYRTLPQPKIISVDAQVDLDPDHRAFSGSGHFVLQNKTSEPISQIHITDQQQSVADVSFDRPFHRVLQAPRNIYAIYQLDQPLKSGEQMNMVFKVGYHSHGFRDGNERPELAYNGMFFDYGYFPFLGYNENIELDDPRRRREEALPVLESLAPRNDPYWSRTSLFTTDSDWIRFHTVVSTPDSQIALAPGYPVRDWHSNGRHYYEYSMGDQPILDFFSYVSGRYAVKRTTYKGVNIEVYSAPQHPYDVDDMIAASKAGLDYYQANFSPFQFKQFRILEFPRYRTFAQSFPNTVPYTESGFLGRVRDPAKDIDFTYFVTAHELAHQWWGHQLLGGHVAGSNMMSESLAEYSALRVMEKRYGEASMHKFLSHELDGYLRGRSGETRREYPLSQVQRETYVWYEKGSMIFYALSDYIGEDKLNGALHNFLMANRYANASDAQDQPYPDTLKMEAVLRAATPPELQYFIDDSFEKITIYDNKAVTATSTKQSDGKYLVTVNVQGGKKYVDGSGNETDTAMHDYIDVGVMSGKKGEEQPLAVRKEWITGVPQTFTFVVNALPTRAGIDPYNKLIDRNGDDNEVDVK